MQEIRSHFVHSTDGIPEGRVLDTTTYYCCQRCDFATYSHAEALAHATYWNGHVLKGESK